MTSKYRKELNEPQLLKMLLKTLGLLA